MNEVLGIVGNHDLEPLSVLFLIETEVFVYPVEAVGFRSGPIMGAEHQVNVRKTVRHRANRLLRCAIIWVRAGENDIVLVADRAQRMFEHSLDHRVLPPQGQQDRNPSARRGLQLANTRWKQSWLRAQTRLDP